MAARDMPPVRLWSAVNPAVGDTQRLRDFRPDGGAIALERVRSREGDAFIERRGDGQRSRKPLRILAIETTTPRRLCPGVVR